MLEDFLIDRNGTTLVAAQIERAIIGKIESGELKTGTKLPSTKVLAEKWNVNPISVQKAMNNLKNAGFVQRRARYGTFIKNPEAKINIGILCQNDLAAEFATYNRLVVASIRNIFLKKNWHSFIYDQFPRKIEKASNIEKFVYEQFVKDVSDGNINAQVEIGLATPNDLPREKLNIPFVRISQVPHSTDILFDYKSFISEAISHSVELGKDKICVLGVLNMPEIMLGINESVEDLGIPYPEIPMININSFLAAKSNGEAKVFASIMELFKKWKNENYLPDTLIVTDDIAMKIIALAILKEGISVPDDMFVISQANEGVDMFYGIPVLKYVFPTIKMSKMAIEILEDRMRGKKQDGQPILVKGNFENN